MASVAASPVGIHCLDNAHAVLGQVDATDLKKGYAHKDMGHNDQVVLWSLKLAHLTFSVNRALLLQFQFELDIVTTLDVENIFHRVPHTAGKGHPPQSSWLGFKTVQLK